jgi:hypothetical protein
MGRTGYAQYIIRNLQFVKLSAIPSRFADGLMFSFNATQTVLQAHLALFEVILL